MCPTTPSVAQTDSKPIELVLPFRQCTPSQYLVAFERLGNRWGDIDECAE